MGQYFESNPEVSSRLQTVELNLPDLWLELTTDRGVFSADRIDPGSKILLVEGPAPILGDGALLDIGTGYGPITCALAKRNPEGHVWGVEVNDRARELCVSNAKSNSLTNVTVLKPDEMPPELTFDRIWSNPPIRIGKQALHDLLLTWLPRLRPEGSAHLVVQKHLGADSLHRWLERQGYRVERRSSRKAYRILDVFPGSATDTIGKNSHD